MELILANPSKSIAQSRPSWKMANLKELGA
jgi:hypothetical protein